MALDSFPTLSSFKVSMLECMFYLTLLLGPNTLQASCFQAQYVQARSILHFVALDYIDLHSLVVCLNNACVVCGSKGPVLAKTADRIPDMLGTFAGGFGRG